MTLTLAPGKATLADLARLYWRDEGLALDASARAGVEAAVAHVEAAARGTEPVYGVNTGFGKLAHVRIPSADTAKLQRNLILSHCAGVGAPLPARIVAARDRAEAALPRPRRLGRALGGDRDASGAAGEAGDPGDPGTGVGRRLRRSRAARAHGRGDAGRGRGRVRGPPDAGAEALAAAGIPVIALAAKEGLALINGTQVSTALALAGVFEAWRLAASSLVTGALSTDAAMGSPAPFRPEIHELRGHRGQIEAAAALRALLEGSEIRETHREGDERVQDPYCIRCQPQVHGRLPRPAAPGRRDAGDRGQCGDRQPAGACPTAAIVSGGNFHAEPVAFAADQIALAIAEIGAIAQRRVALMVDPTLNFDLPAFLSPAPGLNSGFMIAEVTSAALMSENKALANPRSVDSTPTSANQEDHVSMACHAARRLLEMNDNLGRILGIELLTAAQGVELPRAAQDRRAPDPGAGAPAPRHPGARRGPLHLPRPRGRRRAGAHARGHRGRRPRPSPIPRRSLRISP